ncbi:uncharacterized protein LOC117182856 isoform X3 [Belonocnema kinseyi]|uniref:uncharacterized protein LOC117182856 isoform X3 n=1 Tax=Belonocnema kinseyi TaxID=2817044 RepID=UPI00143D8E5C|nr:uncharacterized protein LOC117182856 isoform X3 [Belonocnema kinseyi]
MGLLLSVLIGCVGVLELLTCLRHATNGIPLVTEHSAPCLFYHNCDSGNLISHDYMCSYSHSSHTNFPTNVKHKLENLHEYSLRVRKDISSLGERYEGTLSDSSTKGILGVSRPDSKLSDDFEYDISGYVEGEETSDSETEFGFRIWHALLLTSEISSNASGSENQNVTKSNEINIFNRTDGVFQNKDEKIISKCVLRHQSITIKAKKHRNKERKKPDESMQTTKDLLAEKYLTTTKKLSTEKKNVISVQLQAYLEENLPNVNTSHGSKDSSLSVQNERPILIISSSKFNDIIVPIQNIDNILYKKQLHSILLKLEETSHVNSAPSEISQFFDFKNCNKKTINKDMNKSKSICLNLSLNDNSGQLFDDYVDLEDEEIMILECQVNAPIKYAVPHTGKSHAFWLIFSDEYTKAMNKDWHSGHFCCWQCDESLTGQRYVLRDEHPYCIKCYESVFANGCEECNKIIGIDSKDLSYKDKHWHEACFLCNKCRVSLVDKQFGSKVDKIYCGNCYDAQFASRCDGCGEIFRAEKVDFPIFCTGHLHFDEKKFHRPITQSEALRPRRFLKICIYYNVNECKFLYKTSEILQVIIFIVLWLVRYFWLIILTNWDLCAMVM